MYDQIRYIDAVARLGGDEFAIILSEISDINDSVQVADKLIAAVYPDHETTADALVKKADQAMYQAKSQGKNRCVTAQAWPLPGRPNQTPDKPLP